MQTCCQSNILPYEAQLIEAARAGNITGLVEHLYTLLRSRAWHLAAGYHAAYGSHLDAEDILQEGIERVLRILDTALAGGIDKPVSWLLRAAQLRMMNYCMENRASIRVPRTSQRKGAKVPTVVSLDAPLDGYDMVTLADLLPAS